MPDASGAVSLTRGVNRPLEELLAQVSELAGPEHRGQDIRQSAQDKAERLLREELERLGWSPPDLLGRRKSNPRKVRIATRLRWETTMTLAWIAERLSRAAHVLHTPCRRPCNDCTMERWKRFGMRSLKI